MTGLVRIPAGIDLPSIADARLPMSYQSAKSALMECETLDECIGWQDRMAALASYARQSQDTSLLSCAMRIQGRATNRVGELLAQIEPQQGSRTDRQLGEGAHPKLANPTVVTPSRKSAASSAGLSPHQAKQALRVAAIPREVFEAAIEAPKPPTVTQLAAMGTKKKEPPVTTTTKPAPVDLLRGLNVEDVRAATRGHGLVTQAAALAFGLDPEQVARGTHGYERSKVLEAAMVAESWIARLIVALEQKGH